MVASIGKILSAVHGVSYYEHDGHHARNDPAHREASAWAGRGATALGLAGPVDQDAFREVLEGRVPHGRRLGRRDRHGNILHRPGRDVTLSAPKSVSLLALVGGDARIVAAHDHAVRQSLDWIEAHAVETRLQDPATGEMVRAGGQGMVAATFRHDTSRNLDPQLHTHCVIANMALGPDGKWRTMVNDGLYSSKTAIGAIYRASLARGLRRLGYRLTRTHADGRFEIAGVSREVVRAFSTRRAQIEAALADRGPEGLGTRPGLAGLAAMVTRSGKRDRTTREEARRAWAQRAGELGFAPGGLIEEAAGRGPERLPLSATDAQASVLRAARCLGRLDVVFAHSALLVTALGDDLGAVTVGEAQAAVETLRGTGRLHPAEGFRHRPHWTLDADIAAASESIASMRSGLGAAPPILRPAATGARLRGSGLFAKRREALALVLSSSDRVIGLTGFHGPAMPAMLDSLRSALDGTRCRLESLALSDTRARALLAESAIESESIPCFICRHAALATGRADARDLRELRASFGCVVLVVFGASLLPRTQMRDLLRTANALRVARLVLLGNGDWTGSPEPGRPFAQLLRAGMSAMAMDEVDRRREGRCLEAARNRLAGVVRKAFDKVGDRVSEVGAESVATAVAHLWLALPRAERDATQVIAQSPALRREINQAIRDGLVADGAVHGPALQCRRLVPLDPGRSALADHSSYSPGDTVVFLRPYRRLGVRRGEERTVAEVHSENSVVRLTDRQGRTWDWKPDSVAARAGGVELFRGEPLELRAGDRVRWTRDEPASGLRAGYPAFVVAIGGGRIRLRLEDGTALALAASDPCLRHLDRAWASPADALPSRATRNILAAVETADSSRATQACLYAALGRVPGAAQLVIDDAARLAEHLAGTTGLRFEVLDEVARNRSPD